MMNFHIDFSHTHPLNNHSLIPFLKQRGVKHIHQFLHPSLKTIEHDIHLDNKHQIHDMKSGTDLIKKAISKDWKIVVYSDYDVDGITSNTIMASLLKQLGAKHVVPYCPSRIYDGYGLNMKESKRMVKAGVKLVITTDNGISCVKEVKFLRKHNVDVIITDHHDWKLNKDGSVNKQAIPPANAIIMPNCPFDKFHFDGFCGGGIAFMIACYMLKRVATEYLDLACLATVADSVPLLQEDRIIVKFGLQAIKKHPRLGIYDLFLASAMDKLGQNQPSQLAINKAHDAIIHLTATDLSFSIIPRLNSLGRLSDANIGRKLLLATK